MKYLPLQKLIILILVFMPFEDILGASIQAGATLLNSTLQYAQNKTDKKFTREMYQRQLQDNRDNWAMNNEYNLPSNQMKRYLDAGLNPHLIYGQGSVASSPAGASTTAYHQNAPQVNPQGIATYLQLKGLALDNQAKQAGIKLTEQEIKNKESDQKLKDAQAAGQEWQNSFNKAVEDLRKSIEQGKVNLLDQQVEQVASQVKNANAITDSQLQTMAQARTEQIRMNNLTVEQVGAQIKVAYKQAEAAYKQAQAALLNAATNSKLAQIKQQELDLAKQKWNTMQRYYEKVIDKTDAELGSIYIDILNKTKDGKIKDAVYDLKQWDILDKNMLYQRQIHGRNVGSHVVDEVGAITDVIMAPFGSFYDF